MLKLEDKRYMQAAAFWQDAHNKKAVSIIDRLMSQRDMLGKIAQNESKDFFQRSDGFVEKKPKSGFFKFLKGPGFYENKFAEDMNKEYAFIKSDLAELSRNVRKDRAGDTFDRQV